MTGLIQDRFWLRQLRKSFGFSSVAAFTIALGLGANSAIFSLVSGILLRPLPYPRPAELVSVTGTYPKGAFSVMREQQVATYAEGHEYNLTHVGDPLHLNGTPVSVEWFSVLEVRRVPEVKAMRTVVFEAVATPASTTFLFSTFAGVALILGIVAIYGVLSFLVSKRKKEIGLRMALGARRGDVLFLVMKEGATFAFAGITIGLGGASLLSKALATQLYGVSPMDSLTYSGVAMLVAIVTMTACYIPARRAMQVDPLIALRYD